MEMWNGFEIRKEPFEGRELTVVVPKVPNGKWAIKTEYFEFFPAVQIELLEMGYYIFYLKNITRWHVTEDTVARGKLAEYIHDHYGLKKNGVIIGMSCGGLQGIYFGAAYPEYVSCMYLDAPVVNLLSYPLSLGKAKRTTDFEEIMNHKGMTFTDLLSYRDHPLDHIPELVEANIPVILVSGDSDSVVPYEENGKLLYDAYKANGCPIELIIKEGGDHHPHSLEDNTPIIEFIKKYDV